MKAICERTMIICSLIRPEPTEIRIWLRRVSRRERARTCRKLSRSLAPRAARAASAKGMATPTMNMNAGWIRSQKTRPSQGT